ncbi:MAG TPA: molybdopterin-dependent oxidoreductase, partial [Candidatus Obscuribacterales bacterium]
MAISPESGTNSKPGAKPTPALVTHYHTCCLCEAMCGLEIVTAGEEILSVRGNELDVFSHGHICPKGVAIQDLHSDPDRLRQPVRRVGDQWETVSWDAALKDIGQRLMKIQRQHGRDAVATYLGNPFAHNYAGLLALPVLLQTLKTRNRYSASSLDQMPMMLASLLMFGHQLLMPVPDLERTSHLLMLGANPLVSNGSLMAAPKMREQIKSLQARGGKLVVIDPRKTETAAYADEHHFIRPGADALLLLGLLHTVFAEGLARPGRLRKHLQGLDLIRTIAADFAPECVATATGIEAATIRRLAREFAQAPAAVCYGRVGTCAQEFGGLASWLIIVLNCVTGRLDEPGGAMFTTPAADLVMIARAIGLQGHFGKWHSRVRGLPEFGEEFPAVALAEEIATPGPGQIKALITIAGNPVLSTPNGSQLETALDQLELMVSLDPYCNETTAKAHYILPPVSALEREHFDLVGNLLAPRNIV